MPFKWRSYRPRFANKIPELRNSVPIIKLSPPINSAPVLLLKALSACTGADRIRNARVVGKLISRFRCKKTALTSMTFKANGAHDNIRCTGSLRCRPTPLFSTSGLNGEYLAFYPYFERSFTPPLKRPGDITLYGNEIHKSLGTARILFLKVTPLVVFRFVGLIPPF